MVRATGIAALLALALASCGHDGGDPDQASTRPPSGHARPLTPAVLPDPPLARPPPPPPVVPLSQTCLRRGSVSTIGQRRSELRLCATHEADNSEHCAVWERATGKLLRVEPRYAVESEPDPSASEQPITADAPEVPDDPRVTVNGARVEVCPEDRACSAVTAVAAADDELELAADAGHHALAILVKGTDEHSGHVELWDIDRGRLRARTPLRDLDPAHSYALSLQVVAEAAIVLAKRDDSDYQSGTIYPLDGTRSTPLASGSPFLAPGKLFDLGGGTVAVVDTGAQGRPFSVAIQRMPTGTLVAQPTIPLDPGTDDDFQLAAMHLQTGELVVMLWNAQLRALVWDPRTRASRAYAIPTCP